MVRRPARSALLLASCRFLLHSSGSGNRSSGQRAPILRGRRTGKPASPALELDRRREVERERHCLPQRRPLSAGICLRPTPVSSAVCRPAHSEGRRRTTGPYMTPPVAPVTPGLNRRHLSGRGGAYLGSICPIEAPSTTSAGDYSAASRSLRVRLRIRTALILRDAIPWIAPQDEGSGRCQAASRETMSRSVRCHWHSVSVCPLPIEWVWHLALCFSGFAQAVASNATKPATMSFIGCLGSAAKTRLLALQHPQVCPGLSL